VDKVSIYIKENCDVHNTKCGRYKALIKTDTESNLIENTFSDTTNYRMIIQGAIDAISMLKQPYMIILHTNSTFGMSRIINSKGRFVDKVNPAKTNADLLEKLRIAILLGGHTIINKYDSELVFNQFNDNSNAPETKNINIELNYKTYIELKDKCKKDNINIKEAIEIALNKYLF